MEDFVPYKLAVKLEQKGFIQEYNILGYRLIFSDENTIRFISDIGVYDKGYFGENIAAPTISQVLKWLREEKKIDVSPCCYRSFQGEFMGWYYLIVDMRADEWRYIDEEIRKNNSKSTYESAALAGIEHVIDNLI